MKESTLYLPIKDYFTSLGYEVKGEIGNVDLIAVRNDISIMVEMKTNITLKLLYQAVDRQKVADYVYVAIPKTSLKSHQKNKKHFIHLLRRLEIGLLLVDEEKVECILDSKMFDRKKSIASNKKKKNKLHSEFYGLQGDPNIGGTKGKKWTKYKTEVIMVASIVKKYGECSIKEIKEESKLSNVSSIIQKNYYGWFNRIKRGRYGLTELGKSELKISLEHELKK